MSDNPLLLLLFFFFAYKMLLKSPEILCDILLSPCFVLFKGVEGSPFIPAAPRDQGGSRGGEDVGSCTPLACLTYMQYIH